MINRWAHAFALTFIMILAGCGEKAPENESVTSSFNVLTIEATKTSLSSEALDVNWKSLSNTLILNLRACIKDTAVAATVVGEGFEIQSPTGSKREITDTNGCLNWSELIEFSPLADENFYEFPITIKGTGHYKGSESLSLAVAPALVSGDKVYDLRTQGLGHALMSFEELNSTKNLKAKALNNENLDFSSLAINLSDYQTQANQSLYRYQLEAKIDLLKKNLDQIVTRRKLESGLFHVRFNLVEVLGEQGEKRVLSTLEKDVKLNKGIIASELLFKIERAVSPHETSTIEMYVELEPINAPIQLGGLSGKISMDYLKGSLAATWDASVEIPQERKELEIQKAEKIDEAKELTQEDILNQELVIDSMNFVYGSFDSKDYNRNSLKTLYSKVGLCIIDPHAPTGSSALSHTLFDVKVFKGENTQELAVETKARLDQSGCLEVSLPVEYQRFGCEKYLPFVVSAKAVEGKIKGLSSSAHFVLNPWNSSDFGYDLAKQTPTPLNCEAPARIILGKMNYKYEGLDYESFKLNKFLHLSLHKLYQFNFSTLIEKFSSTTNESVQPLTFGRVKLKALIFSPKKDGLDYIDPDLNDFEFLSATEKTINIDAKGEATDVLSFPFYASETCRV